IACMAAHPGPALARWLDDREQAGHLALRAAVKALPMDHLARAGVAMLRFQCIARTVTDMLVHPGTPELRSRILESSVLMRVHGRRARARVTPEQVARLIGPAERFASLPEAARRGAIGWISSIASTGSGMKVLDLLTPRLADPAASVRFDAVAAIESMPASPTGDALLTDFAFDADERVASRAVSALVSARSASRRAAVRQKLESLRRSPHRRVRSLVLDMESLIDPWAVTNGEPWRCAAAAREELVRDKSAFCDELRRRVGCGEPAQRLAAMRLAERLNTAEDIEHELVVASRDSDARVASKAVQLLGRVPTEPARRAVREALANPEMRVRANALEIAPPALLDTEGVRRFMEDEAPRIRANAVRRALSARPDDARASRVLVDMLGDARPGHRASGLWVTERLARRGVPIMEALSERVDALARAEREPLVAARAARCARRLFAEMRLGWARPPVRGVAAERGVQWDRVEEGAPPARSAAA
ncbi:MAG TPA: hypothetical protein VG797_00760, partial [Phycisphaerales bacterium]|nr:hypothetical protein [Phycisphaerales bacterium]